MHRRQLFQRQISGVLARFRSCRSRRRRSAGYSRRPTRTSENNTAIMELIVCRAREYRTYEQNTR
jgi:hypothetical protein